METEARREVTAILQNRSMRVMRAPAESDVRMPHVESAPPGCFGSEHTAMFVRWHGTLDTIQRSSDHRDCAWCDPQFPRPPFPDGSDGNPSGN